MSSNCPICNKELAGTEATCPSCGYRLPGSTQEFKPVVPEQAKEEHANASKRCELRVVRGPQTGVSIPLGDGSFTIGRDPQCDIFLNDMTVSRKHAIIETKDDGCIITDTNSYNGVWVNDKMMEKCLLKSGDMIQIGAFCLAFRESKA